MQETNVERQLGILIGKLEAIEDRFDRADDSRGRMHERIDEMVLRATHIETDVLAIKGKVGSIEGRIDSVEQVTEDVKKLRHQAAGAGTAGRYLIKIGIGVVTAAGWAAAAYTWMTGRPPP